MRVFRALGSAALALLAVSPALADGHVFHRPAQGPIGVLSRFLVNDSQSRGIGKADEPVIPDQRALIVHRDGRETLTIETAFAGRGTDFAWVVPTPSVPVIEEASSELFPALVAASRPDLISRIPDLRIAGGALVVVLLLARHASGTRRRSWRQTVAGAAIAATLAQAAAGAATPGGGVSLAGPPAPSLSGLVTPREEFVSVRQRQIIGAFDTVTLSARDPHALAAWLDGHGYAAPDGLEEVAAAYVRDGWVFNAIRLHRDADTPAAVRIQPLSFTFPSAAPVYPMRLTGLATQPVYVQLYVVADRRAAADGFTAARCASTSTSTERSGGPGLVVLPHFDRFVPDARVLTRLDRTFRPEEMDADVAVRWEPYATTQPLVFSSRAAEAFGWNVALLAAVGTLVALASAESGRPGRRPLRPAARWAATVVVVAGALALGMAVGALLPKADTRPVAENGR